MAQAPRGNIITSAGEPSSVAQDLIPTLHTEITPSRTEAAATPKGVKFVAAGIRKLVEWRAFFLLL